MEDNQILDISHISFLDMITELIHQAGPAPVKGMLIRNALKAGERMELVDFPTFEDFVGSIEGVENSVTSIEGKAVHLGDGLFGLPKCPFAGSIGHYKRVFKELPESYSEVTKEYNKQGPMTDNIKIGSGAGVSPFCAVHQPLRSALSDKITIGGKPVRIYQLGCKSGAGSKGFADKWIDETGISKETVSKVLDDNMCCYVIKFEQ